MSDASSADNPPDKPAPGLFESLGKKLDQRPEVRAAEEAIAKARAELVAARRRYRRLRRQTTRRLRRLRRKSVGDLVSDSVNFVREHPRAGTLLAGAIGFLLGRFSRR